MEALKSVLGRVCENPTNPIFNHFMFETIASLVRFICASQPAAVDAFEGLLFPPFQFVLQKDVAEFTPYVFQVRGLCHCLAHRRAHSVVAMHLCAVQVLAQLLECRASLSPAYESLFSPLLAPNMWERPANIPALVRLLCAYMAKGKLQARAL